MSDRNPHLTYHGQYDNDEEDFSTEQQQKGKPSVKLTSGHADVVNTKHLTDIYDRPGSAYAEGNYVQAGKYVESHEDKQGKSIPKAGAFAKAGTGQVHAEYSVFEAEVKGPNASAGAEASVVGIGAMARAEIGSVSANAGRLGVKVGLGVDTGASVGLNGVEAKLLGTGFSVGQKNSVSVLGSEASCSVM